MSPLTYSFPMMYRLINNKSGADVVGKYSLLAVARYTNSWTADEFDQIAKLEIGQQIDFPNGISVDRVE